MKVFVINPGSLILGFLLAASYVFAAETDPSRSSEASPNTEKTTSAQPDPKTYRFNTDGSVHQKDYNAPNPIESPNHPYSKEGTVHQPREATGPPTYKIDEENNRIVLSTGPSLNVYKNWTQEKFFDFKFEKIQKRFEELEKRCADIEKRLTEGEKQVSIP